MEWKANSNLYNTSYQCYTDWSVNMIDTGPTKVQNTHVKCLKKILSRGLFYPVSGVTLNTDILFLDLSMSYVTV